MTDATVYIVDDDEAIRDSFSALLGSMGLTTRCYGSAQEFLEALDLTARGCLLLDVRLPDMTGLDVQARLAEAGVRLPIIFMTAYADVPIAVKAMQNGAVDFVEKPIADDVVLERIGRALEMDRETASRQASAAEVETHLDRLTPRERDVFEHMIAGRQNKEIARALDISPRTVEVHRARVMEKMGARSLSHLVRMALTAGRVPDTG